MKVFPVEGRLVRDPATGREITEGTVVPDNDSFWLRRIADRDVALEAPAKTEKKGA